MRSFIFALVVLNSYVFGGLFDFLDNKKIYESYQNKEYADALRELYKKDETPIVNYNIANCYYKLDEFKKALKYYKKALGVGVDEYSRLYNIGNCYFSLKEYDKAKTAYSVASKFKKGDKDLVENLKLIENILKHSKVEKQLQKEKKLKEKHKKDSKKKSKKLTRQELEKMKKMLEKEKLKDEMQQELKKMEKGKIPVIMYEIEE